MRYSRSRFQQLTQTWAPTIRKPERSHLAQIGAPVMGLLDASLTPACFAPTGHPLHGEVCAAMHLVDFDWLASAHIRAQFGTWRVAERRSHLNMGLFGSSGIVKYSGVFMPLRCQLS